VYLGVSGDMGSVRTVTVYGTTGQIRLYKLYPNTNPPWK
jgi:hypothetical protein